MWSAFFGSYELFSSRVAHNGIYENPKAGVCNWIILSAIAFGLSLRRNLMARVANGNRPLENARRQRAYEEAREAALKAAEPVKAAQDHRLRCQIRELEGLIETVTDKAEDVRRLLITL
jgi:hypothetical protein